MKKTHTLLLALFLCLALIFPCALAEDAYVPGQRTQALIDAALDAGQVVGGETRLTFQLGDEILSMLADDEESQAQIDALTASALRAASASSQTAIASSWAARIPRLPATTSLSPPQRT